MANEETKRACLNLRCKQMFYKDVTAPPTEHEQAVWAAFGKWDTTAYWCQCTQDSRGPDAGPVNKEACSKTRECYKGLEDLA